MVLSLILISLVLNAQRGENEITKLTKEDLAGENLSPLINENLNDTSFYQQIAYDGSDFTIYMVSIANRTNQFRRFPIEEFVFWADGKAIVEPDDEEPVEITAGDYFIQPKGFSGKFNFVSGSGSHLELTLISKRRADSASVSPMTKAKIIDRQILSGSSILHAGENAEIYRGVELQVNLVRHRLREFNNNPKERLIHLLSGVLTMITNERMERYYPGDYLIIPKGFTGKWQSDSVITLRALEVMQVEPN